MNDFEIFFPTGFNHLLGGVDHMLFIAVLTIRYQYTDWKKLLVLVTAFTIGHSLTLVLSVFNVFDYSRMWIEFLIPVTIVITALSNVFVKDFSYRARFPLIYFFALAFGLVHGLGFSTYLKDLMGKDANVVWELLSFNLGLEAGQLLIVAVVLLISFIFVQILKCGRREWLLFVTGGIFALALQMALERVPF